MLRIARSKGTNSNSVSQIQEYVVTLFSLNKALGNILEFQALFGLPPNNMYDSLSTVNTFQSDYSVFITALTFAS